jgi:hypothetical protein
VARSRPLETQLDRIVVPEILPPKTAVDPEHVRRFHQQSCRLFVCFSICLSSRRDSPLVLLPESWDRTRNGPPQASRLLQNLAYPVDTPTPDGV